MCLKDIRLYVQILWTVLCSTNNTIGGIYISLNKLKCDSHFDSKYDLPIYKENSFGSDLVFLIIS